MNLHENHENNPVREGAGVEAPERTVFEVPKNAKVLPCRIDADFPVYNPRRTSLSVTVYTSLTVKKFKQHYLIAAKKTYSSREFVAPVGAFVRVVYTSCSGRHTYYSYTEYFLVSEVGVREHEFRVKGAEPVKGSVKNLVPLDLSGFSKAEIEAEIMNIYGAKLSEYDPVEVLYYLWIKRGVANSIIARAVVTPAAPASDIEEEVRKLEELIKQKEQELQMLREQLQQLQLKLQLERMKKQMVE